MKARYERLSLTDEAGVRITEYRNLVNLPHWHLEHELVYVKKGSAELMSGNELYKLGEGMCAFICGEDIHYIKSPEGSVISVMKITQKLVRAAVGNSRPASPVIENCYPVTRSFEEILSEQKKGDIYSGIICGSIALRLAAELFRGERTVPRDTGANRQSRKYKELISYISEHYAGITFDEAAEFMCLSRPYFSKYFRHISGMTFTQYLNMVKVSAASEMIAEREGTMTDIAIKCGFGTIRSFNRVFRELTGYSPSALPEGYSFIRSGMEENGFDPTLSCTEKL